MASGDVHILDVEFKVNLQIARGFIKQMMLADDRRVCEKYIRFCMSMKDSDQEKVKFHRNRFFKYLLKTMKRTVETQKASVYMNEVRGKICLLFQIPNEYPFHSLKWL